MHHQEITQFWFNYLKPKDWWRKSPHLDQLIRDRFEPVLIAAVKGELSHWRQDADGALAEIIVLDQFSRNIYRDTANAFSNDPQALVLAQHAVLRGQHLSVPPVRRAFMLLPYMHSESLHVHRQALALFDAPGLESNYQFELRHLHIIERFGRYPHRNHVLGRPSSAEEAQFLSEPGSSF